MRVIIKATSAAGDGRKFVLTTGQTLKIGRTEWADVAFPRDDLMSGIHFALEADVAACHLEDLHSSNGTLVNGRRIAEKAELHDGDEILAGRTTFVVQIHEELRQTTLAGPSAGRAPMPAEAPVRPFVPGPPVQQAPVPAARPQITYTVERCESGLTLCRGNVADLPPADLAVMLCQSYPVYLIVDFKNLGRPRPAELTAPNYLFDWFDAAAAAVASPVVIGQDELLTWPSLIEEGWGSDGVVCLFSNQEKGSLLEHLRFSVRSKARGGGTSGGIIGYCWPSVLAPLLTHYTREFVLQLLAGIDAVLVELPDLPDTWQVYAGGTDIVRVLDKAGLVQKGREKAGA